MATLAELLDKPGPAVNNYECSESSSSSSAGIVVPIIKGDPEMEIQYGLFNKNKNNITTTSSSDDSVLVTSTSGGNSSSPPVFKPSSKKSSPGSGLSFIATSLPHPRGVIQSPLPAASRGKVKVKSIPALSPIDCSLTSQLQSALSTKETLEDSEEEECVVNIKHIIPKVCKEPKRRKTKLESLPGVRDDDNNEDELEDEDLGRDDDHEKSEEMMKQNKKIKNRIKRPLNAFMVWSKMQRRTIMDNDPTVHHSLISKQLGTEWKALTTAERLPFYEEAKRLSELHSQIYPDYKYQPRKRSKGGPPFPPGFDNLHSNSSSSDLSISTKGGGGGSESLLNVQYQNSNGSFIRQSQDGSLDLSMKKQQPPIQLPSSQGVSSRRRETTDLLNHLGRRNSCFSSSTAYSESDSADSTLELGQPLNMSLKSRNLKSSKSQGVESESDEDRLVIDEN